MMFSSHRELWLFWWKYMRINTRAMADDLAIEWLGFALRNSPDKYHAAAAECLLTRITNS